MTTLTLYPHDFPGGLFGSRKRQSIKRAFHPKSRTGCILCRQRHVKCDNQQPCSRCRKAKLDCPGPRSLPRSHLVDLNNDELRSLQHFRERTSDSLAGNYDTDFWTSMTRVCYTSEALQHFVVALSSLDEAFRLRASCPGPSEIARSRYLFSLKEYGTALAKAAAETRDGHGSIVMITSVVFCFFFELWLGDMLGAQKHATTAEKLILSQNLSANDESRDLLRKHIRPAIGRLCSQFSSCSFPRGNNGNNHTTPDLVAQSPFVDHADAKSRLKSLTISIFSRARAYQQLDNCDADALRQSIQKLQDDLDHWYDELLALIRRIGKDRTSGDEQQQRLLEIRYRYFKINLAVLPFQDEMLYDNYLDDFERIVEGCEEILKYTANNNPGVHRSAEMTPIQALSFAGSSCRDPTIRRRAIRLLYRYRRQEGVWSSLACGSTTEHVLMLEEENLSSVQTCSDVPASRRVRPFSISYDSGRKRGEKMPRFILTYLRPHLAADTLQERIIQIEKYTVMSDYGNESIVWYPKDPRAPLMESEIAAAEKNQDGPLMLPLDSWTVFFNYDLEKASKMTFMELSFEEPD